MCWERRTLDRIIYTWISAVKTTVRLTPGVSLSLTQNDSALLNRKWWRWRETSLLSSLSTVSRHHRMLSSSQQSQYPTSYIVRWSSLSLSVPDDLAVYRSARPRNTLGFRRIDTVQTGKSISFKRNTTDSAWMEQDERDPNSEVTVLVRLSYFTLYVSHLRLFIVASIVRCSYYWGDRNTRFNGGWCPRLTHVVEETRVS